MKKLLSLALSLLFALGVVGASWGQMQAPATPPMGTEQPAVGAEQPAAPKKVKKAKKAKRAKKAKKAKKAAAPAQ